MNPKFIIRLDDASQTMTPAYWNIIEGHLDTLNIKPIVGVIPDNRDPKLLNNFADPQFWNRVQSWQAKGWTIALHGLHHKYHLNPMDATPLIPFTKKSEFVGLSLEKQRELLANSYKLFKLNGVTPTMFMAPSHSFDKNTLKALQLETPIQIITDGHALFPFQKFGFTWVPQQIAKFRKLPFGTWTICLHPETLNEKTLKQLLLDINSYSKYIVDVNNVLRADKDSYIKKILNTTYKYIHITLYFIKYMKKT